MRKKISIFALAGIFAGGSLIGLSEGLNKNLNPNINQIFNSSMTDNALNSQYQTNLTKIILNPFETDLSILDGKKVDSESYLEEIRDAMLISNKEQVDILIDIWSSIMYDNPNDWEIVGLNLVVPERGKEEEVRIKFKAVNSPYFKGVLSFRTKLVNKRNSIVDISEIFKEKSIGKIQDKNIDTIWNVLKEKSYATAVVWGELDLIETQNSEFKLFAIEGSKYYKGSVKLTYNLLIDLDRVIINKNLGQIRDTITNNEILKVTKTKNSALLTNEIEITSRNDARGTAVIEPKKNSDKYFGKVEVSFGNIKNISTLVTEDFLGRFANPIRTVIEKSVLLKNQKLSENGHAFNFGSIDYSSITIIGIEKAGYYGTVRLTFSSYLSRSVGYDSGKLWVESYKNEKNAPSNSSFSIIAEFGKSNFLARFRSITFDTTQTAWHNGNQNNHTFKRNARINVVLPLNLTGSSGTVILYNATHNNVNWMKSYSTISYSWSGDILVFRFYSLASAKASAWNAQYAKAEARTYIRSLS